MSLGDFSLYNADIKEDEKDSKKSIKLSDNYYKKEMKKGKKQFVRVGPLLFYQ